MTEPDEMGIPGLFWVKGRSGVVRLGMAIGIIVLCGAVAKAIIDGTRGANDSHLPEACGSKE